MTHVQSTLDKTIIFGHFIAFAAITVISLKIYKILQKLLNHFRSNWDFEFGHFIANVAITVISLKIYKIYISSNSNYCSWNEDFEFEHFSKIISILVISEKIYIISLKLQSKPGVIKMKTTQWNIWDIFSPRWTKHSYLDISSQLPL